MNTTRPLTSIQQKLLSLGITTKEARLYTTLLSMGQQSASIIAKRLEVGRSTAQFLCESLVDKNLVTKTLRQKITFYKAITPQELISYIEQKQQQQKLYWETVQADIEALVPDLESISISPVGNTRVKSYEGKEGVKYVIEDLLTAQGTLRTFFSYEGRDELFPNSYFNECRKAREEKNIHVMAIYPDTPKGLETYEKAQKKPLKDVRLVDHKKYQWEPEIRLYDNKVSFVSHREQSGIIIESQMIVEAMQVLFDLAWEGKEEREDSE